ncbi:MAG: phosphoglycerate mutase, partial [bacterium]
MLASNKRLQILSELSIKTDSKILLVVMDGLGGLPGPNGLTELESAKTPNLDSLVKDGRASLGLTDPISPGITPGSGPAHMSLFGYDPVETWIGRGLLSALGINFHLEKNDVAARANYCTIDKTGIVTDRRAGRIATAVNIEISKCLDGIEIDGVKVFVKPEMEHRAVVVFRGEGLSEKITDTDPQKTGLKPLDPSAHETNNATAKKTIDIIKKFLAIVKDKLSDQDKANYMLLRGFAEMLKLPQMNDIYKLNTAAVAAYPMYKGLAKLVGMKVLDVPGLDVTDEIKTLKANYKDHDFIFFHYKKTDSAGEDGNFDKKV